MSDIVSSQELTGSGVSKDAILQKYLKDKFEIYHDKYAPKAGGLFDVTNMLGIDGIRQQRAANKFNEEVVEELISTGGMDASGRPRALLGLGKPNIIETEIAVNKGGNLKAGPNFDRTILQSRDAAPSIESLGLNSNYVAPEGVSIIDDTNQLTNNISLRKKDKFDINKDVVQDIASKTANVSRFTPDNRLPVNDATGLPYSLAEMDNEKGKQAHATNNLVKVIDAMHQPQNKALDQSAKIANKNFVMKALLGAGILLSD